MEKIWLWKNQERLEQLHKRKEFIKTCEEHLGNIEGNKAIEDRYLEDRNEVINYSKEEGEAENCETELTGQTGLF